MQIQTKNLVSISILLFMSGASAHADLQKQGTNYITAEQANMKVLSASKGFVGTKSATLELLKSDEPGSPVSLMQLTYYYSFRDPSGRLVRGSSDILLDVDSQKTSGGVKIYEGSAFENHNRSQIQLKDYTYDDSNTYHAYLWEADVLAGSAICGNRPARMTIAGNPN